MRLLTYESIEEKNDTQMEILYKLWIPYMREIYREDSEFNDTDEELKEGARQRVMAAAARKDMFFELVIDENQAYVGFLFYAVDHGGIPGVLPAGFGYIMEVYAAPAYRRRGYATQMYERMMEKFHMLHTEHFYLTPDFANGIPFWTAMGFRDSGLIDPDNQMPIYVKGGET